MDTDSFIVYKKTEEIYSDIAEGVKNTSNYELDRPLRQEKKKHQKKMTGLMTDE